MSKILFFQKAITRVKLLVEYFIKMPLKLGKSIGIMIFLQIIPALCGLIYSKILTSYVDPIEFGLYNIQMGIMMLFHAVLISPTIQSGMASFQYHSIEKSLPFYLVLLTFLYGVSICCILIFAPENMSFNNGLLICAAASIQGFYLIHAGYLLVSAKYKLYTIIQGLNSIISLVAISCAIIFDFSVSSSLLWIIFLTINIVQMLVCIFISYQLNNGYQHIFKWPLIEIKRKLFAEYLSYTSPLFIYAIFAWLNNYIDRYLLEKLMGLKSVGYYSIGYSLGAKMSILATPFVTHLTPLIFELKKKGKLSIESRPIILGHLKIFWSLAFPICLFLFFFRTQVGLLLLSDSYEPAFIIVPIIAFSYSFIVTIQFFETKFYAYGKTKYILFHSVAGAFVNICANLILVPKFGIFGSALSAVISAFFQVLIVYHIFNKTSLFLQNTL